MAYIWHTNINGEVELHEDAVRLVPELKGLPPRVMKFIVLFKDYRLSPIKDFPDEQRERLAFMNSGIPDAERGKVLKSPKVKRAMEVFESLIYDERRELKRIYQDRLDLLKLEIRDRSLSLKEIKEKKEFIEFFRKEVENIEKELSTEGYDDDGVELKGKRELSYIERWQRRIKKFKEMSHA